MNAPRNPASQNYLYPVNVTTIRTRKKPTSLRRNDLDSNGSQNETRRLTMRNGTIRNLTLGALVAVTVLPSVAMAGDRNDHRQSQKDTWKGLTIASAVVGLAGLATHNNDLAFAGAAGAAYSAYRANADDCRPGDRYYSGPVHYINPTVDYRRDDWRRDDRNRDRGRDRDRDRNRDRDRDRDRGHDRGRH